MAPTVADYLSLALSGDLAVTLASVSSCGRGCARAASITRQALCSRRALAAYGHLTSSIHRCPPNTVRL
jgi:hypothetical protein